MSLAGSALDAALGILILALAARALFTRDLFEAIVLFIAFGFTLALVWVRLGAADVALAEAALGAGVTGALLLGAFRSLARERSASVQATRAGSRDLTAEEEREEAR